MVHIFHIFLRPAVATSIISLLSVINPVSAHVKTPSRPRAHAAAIQLRSFNAVDVDFARRENVSPEVRQLNGRGLIGDTLGGVGDTVDSLLGTVLGGGGSTTATSNPPANSTPAPAPSATTGTQATGGGNTGNPGNSGASTVTNGSGHPTTSNTQNTQNIRTNPSSATASNPGQQTPKATSFTTDANGSTVVVVGTGSLTGSSGATNAGPNDSIITQNAIAQGTGNVQKSTIVETKTHLSTLPDGSVSTSVEITTSTVDVPRNGNNQSDDGDKGPSPVLIGVVVPFFILLLLVGIGLFIWRRKKRQAILLSSSSSSGLGSTFGTPDEWSHGRDSTKVSLGRSAASMGSGGAAPDMKERRKSGPVGPVALDRHARLSVRSPSPASSHMSIPPDLSPVLVKFNQYPDPRSYITFANAPDSSSEDHSTRHGRSAAYHYEASTETLDPLPASLETLDPHPGFLARSTSPITEQSYHTAFHGDRRALSPTQRLSGIESIRTPRASVLNPFADGAQVQRPSEDSGANIAVDYLRPVAPSPLTSTFGPTGEPQPSSPFVTGGGRDAESMRNRTLTRVESFATAKSNKTGSTVTLSLPPTRQKRGNSVSVTSITSTEEFYSATSHDSPSLSFGHFMGNGQSSSSGHYVTAAENPFADPSPQGSSEDSRYSTASQASETSAASHVVSVQAHVVQHRGTSARAEVVPAMPLRPPRNFTIRPTTGESSSGQSIISSEPDPEAARCVSPDEAELFYRPLPTHRERDERPSDETTVAEEIQRPIAAKARKILGVHT